MPVQDYSFQCYSFYDRRDVAASLEPTTHFNPSVALGASVASCALERFRTMSFCLLGQTQAAMTLTKGCIRAGSYVGSRNRHRS